MIDRVGSVKPFKGLTAPARQANVHGSCLLTARAAVLAIAIALGAAGCGPSAEQVRQAQEQAQRSQQAADRAQAAAAQAQKAAAAAAVEADRARQAVDDAMREINRVSDHIDEINRRRAERNADQD
jgi:uncharacterized protein HemX